jgi:sugar transferase (PEP-CTERM system associated)
MRVSSRYLESRKRVLFVGEQLALFAAFVGASLLAGRLLGQLVGWQHLVAEAAVVTAALQIGLYLADLYDFGVAWRDAPRAERLLKSLGATTIVCGVGTLLLPADPTPRAAAVAGLGGACTVALLLRALLPDLGRRVSLRARVLVLGRGSKAAARLLDEIARDGHSEVAGALPVNASALLARARALEADTLAVAVDDRRGLDIRELLACRLAGLEVISAITFAERALQKIPVELARPSDLVFSDGFERSPFLLFTQRALALAAAGLLFLLAAPILLVAALLIKLDSPGPVFYTQERVGMNGRVFKMFKFRTMRSDAEHRGVRWAEKDDPRVTRIGRYLRRFRVDELPQLLNVLRGEMSVVGPRPERPEFVARLRTQIPYYDLRALVRPGITGWAQIRYPYAASLEEAREKLQYDLYYVKHLSLLFDLKILFHTAKVVVFGRGAR